MINLQLLRLLFIFRSLPALKITFKSHFQKLHDNIFTKFSKKFLAEIKNQLKDMSTEITSRFNRKQPILFQIFRMFMEAVSVTTTVDSDKPANQEVS